MANIAAKTRKTHPQPRVLAGILVSSMNMEDSIAHSVYRDYMDRAKWPSDLEADVFTEIQKHLRTLLDDTQRHRNIIKHIESKLRQHENPSE